MKKQKKIKCPACGKMINKKLFSKHLIDEYYFWSNEEEMAEQTLWEIEDKAKKLKIKL